MGTSIGTLLTAFQSELAQPTKQTVKSEILNRKNELILKLLAVLEQHAADEAKIFSNESLSGQGKQQALRRLGNETAPRLKWIGNVIRDMEAVDQRFKTRFFTINSGIEDPAVRMPTFTYLWSKLDTLDPNERITRFSQAAEGNEVLVLAGMLANPLGAMVTEEVKERALIERAKRLTPREYENFEQNQLLLEYMTMVRDWVGRWLFGEVGVEIQPIREALGDALANALTVQRTGIPTETDTQLAAASN